jgi:hypothetical protein
LRLSRAGSLFFSVISVETFNIPVESFKGGEAVGFLVEGWMGKEKASTP